MIPRRTALVLAVGVLSLLVVAAATAPEHLGPIVEDLKLKGPRDVWPFGADNLGRPLLEYAQQGARIVVGPALLAGGLTGVMAVVGGLLRCVGSERLDAGAQAFSEVVGALPRMVVILVAALMLPSGARGLLSLALVWAFLSSPGAMDEAAAVSERLGGARFVEALRAHGFSWSRIFLYHVVGLNLRPVVARQGAEVVMQVTFLELGLSYLANVANQSSFTHGDAVHSWADLLRMGYPSLLLIGDGPSGAHALVLGLVLVGLVMLISLSVSSAVRAR
jgi:ABC-type dipeptide/oligopeptide/nickel transport system permease subunit